MPKEKYSPLLLVLRSYLRPVSTLTHSTVAPTIGLPCVSLQTPFTLVVSWAKAGPAHRPAVNIKSASMTKYCFIGLASGSNLNFRLRDSMTVCLLSPFHNKESDRPRRLAETPADEAHNYRTLRRRDPPDCNRTTLNRMVRPVQGRGPQFRTFAGLSAESRFRCRHLSFRFLSLH